LDPFAFFLNYSIIPFFFPFSSVCTSVGIKDPPVPKPDTQETKNLDKAISFDQKGEGMYLLQLSRHVSTLRIFFKLYCFLVSTFLLSLFRVKKDMKKTLHYASTIHGHTISLLKVYHHRNGGVMGIHYWAVRSRIIVYGFFLMMCDGQGTESLSLWHRQK
jgi:hypothetical protein